MEKSIQPTEYSLTLRLDGDKTWQQDIELFSEIVPAECRLDLMSTKLELWLKKKSALRWSSLERKEGSVPVAPGVIIEPTAAKKVEPYASKKKVNWDKFVAEQGDLDDDDPLNKVSAQKNSLDNGAQFR